MTATLARTDRLAMIRARIQIQDPGTCYRCGEELAIAQISRGTVTYRCSSITLDNWIPIGDPGWKEQRAHYQESLREMRVIDPDVTWLIDEVGRLEKELAWYADKRNWSCQEPDLGARARAALKGGGA